MSLIPKSPLAVWIFLILAGTASINAAPEGFMEGHLKIVSPRQAEPSDDNMPRPGIAPGSYAEYPLVILSEDNKREITRLTADENGNYRATLPPGPYLLDIRRPAAKRIGAKPQPFTIVSNQTVRVDMNIFIGFR